MYQSSKEFGNLIQQDSRTFYALLSWDGNTVTDGISEITIEGGSNSEEDFSIGSTVSRYAKIKMTNPGKRIEGKEIIIKIGMLVDGTMEYIPMGYYTAEKPKTDEGQITVTAYDRMMKTERPFSADSIGETTDTVSVLEAISKITRVTVITASLTAIAMKRPDGYTCREILGYISQMYGGFATCNREGQIEIKSYIDSGYPVDTSRYWDTFEHHDVNETIEKITCYTGKDADGKDVSISVGSGTREISFSNPFMTQDILNNIWKELKSYEYMPGSVKIMGDPRLDPWDVLTVSDLSGETYKVPVMTMTHEFDGGLVTSVEAVGRSETEQESGYKGPTTKQMDRYYAQLVVIDKAMVNKLDADEANITYATIKNLKAEREYVEKIYGEYGEFKDLVAEDFKTINETVSNLNASYANIKSLLSGSAGIGDLQNIHLTTENATIDNALIKNAVMETVTISDLLAGTISTNTFKIMSDDGGILIEGATQQWKDKDGIVRMQAGMDAQGNFTFSLFDETGKGVLIDSTGVKPGAIADGLIVNDMVSDSANIAASKLDIESLFTEINGSSQTIKSDRIWLDESKQSLQQAYTSITKDMGEVHVEVSDIRTGLKGVEASLSEITIDADKIESLDTNFNIVQGTISALITESELQELKNDEKTMYSRMAATEQNIKGLTQQYSDLQTKYDDVSGKYSDITSLVANYETTVEGFSANLAKLSTHIEDDYSTTEQMNLAIKASTDGIMTEVQEMSYCDYCTNGDFHDGISGWKYGGNHSPVKTSAYLDKKCAYLIRYSGGTAAIMNSSFLQWEYTVNREQKNKFTFYLATKGSPENIQISLDDEVILTVGKTADELAEEWKEFSVEATVSKGEHAFKIQVMDYGKGIYVTDIRILAGHTDWAESRFAILSDSISTEVKRASDTETSLSSQITQTAEAIQTKVEKGSVISEINQTAEEVQISAAKINFNGMITANKYFEITTAGAFAARSGTIANWKVQSDKIYSTDETITLYGGSNAYIKIGNAQIAASGNAATIKSGLWIYADSGEFTDGSGQIRFYNLGAISGKTLVLASDKHIGTLASSSKRYKDPMGYVEMKEAEKILKIPVVRFKYRDGYLCKDDELYGKTIPGFYAENINKVLPNVVMHDENGVPEDWNYRILVPLMVKMIQGMAQRIEVLERRVS